MLAGQQAYPRPRDHRRGGIGSVLKKHATLFLSPAFALRRVGPHTVVPPLASRLQVSPLRMGLLKFHPAIGALAAAVTIMGDTHIGMLAEKPKDSRASLSAAANAPRYPNDPPVRQ